MAWWRLEIEVEKPKLAGINKGKVCCFVFVLSGVGRQEVSHCL